MSIFDTINILMIEDEPAIADLIKMELIDNRPRGWIFKYNLKHCKTLKTAKKYISGGAWDVILLDLGLPDSNGFATFEQVVSVAKAPVIVLTGTEDYELLNEIENHSPGQRCYVKTHIAHCWFFLHYIIKNVIRETRRNYQLEILQGASLDELRKIVINDCSNCGKWRHPTKDKYITPVEFLHQFGIFATTGICPDCRKEKYGHLTGES